MEYSNVGFIFQITDPSGTCVIYQEHVGGYNMNNSAGIFDVPIGTGSVSWPKGVSTVVDTFNNSSTFTCGACSGFTCSSGTSTYNPITSDGRLLRVSFYDGSGWKIVSPDTAIRAVPFAGYAQSALKLGTHNVSDFVLKAQVNSGSSCGNGSFLTWDSITQTFGCSTSGSSSITSVTATAPLISSGGATPTLSLAGLTGLGSASQILGMNSGATAYEYKTISGTTNRVTVTNSGNSISLSGPQDIAISSSPTFVGMTLTGMSPAGIVKNNASGVLSGGNSISMTSDVSGILPIANGGTNTNSFANYSVIASNSSGSALTAVSGSMSGSVLQYSATGPEFSTASYPSTTTANQLLYSSANNVVGGLATANNSVLTTNSSGIPSFSTISGDLFSQYALLAGRSGGQMLYGGTAASNGITIDSTSSGTKGDVILNPSGGNVGIGTTSPSSRLTVNGTIESTSGGIKFPDGTIQNSARGGPRASLFTSSGSFVVPAGITSLKVTVIGGGGGGGYYNFPQNVGGGGGGSVTGWISGLTPGSSISVTVGAGGAGVTSGIAGTGGTSSFGAYLTATGGAGGNSTTGAYSTGGAGTGGTFNLTGNTGYQGSGGASRGQFSSSEGYPYGQGGSPSATNGVSGQNGTSGMILIEW